MCEYLYTLFFKFRRCFLFVCFFINDLSLKSQCNSLSILKELQFAKTKKGETNLQKLQAFNSLKNKFEKCYLLPDSVYAMILSCIGNAEFQSKKYLDAISITTKALRQRPLSL